MNRDYIFNCTTNNVGGAVQNAVNFIRHLHEHNLSKEWHFFLSKEVYEQVKEILTSSYDVVDSPAKNLSARRFIRTRQVELEAKVVYTSAGPAYVDFECMHIMGCSNPYILGADKLARNYRTNSFEKLKRNLHTIYQRFYIFKADKWIVQTQDSLYKLKSLGVSEGDCYLVHNAISNEFKSKINRTLTHNTRQRLGQEKIRILVPSAYYRHKNIEIVPDVVNELDKRGVDVTITITIPSSKETKHIFEKSEKLGVENRIVNIGPYKHSDAVKIYSQHDLVLQPSLLEVFSTSYIEAQPSPHMSEAWRGF